MSQSSSGIPVVPSPESPPLHEQGLLPDPAINNTETQMDTSQTEAATLMLKVQKHQSAATNIRSPTWERASLTTEECSRRIRAICTYTGVPASHLPTKKELAELKKGQRAQRPDRG
ncbi:hypothetical protein CDAR_510701 [Caerostris darwini]|uniref:Uncharacterized protein n=1 Tax=Caerostris darwini TaxID=1538125 RepID=A0AAV4VNL8_9ARAC|nr:hypothetical protein CDAR_510701 [Caerostris darwini]